MMQRAVVFLLAGIAYIRRPADHPADLFCIPAAVLITFVAGPAALCVLLWMTIDRAVLRKITVLAIYAGVPFCLTEYAMFKDLAANSRTIPSDHSRDLCHGGALIQFLFDSASVFKSHVFCHSVHLYPF